MKPDSPFFVGEIVWYWRPGKPYHKTECTVTSELFFGSIIDEGQTREAWVHNIDGPFEPQPYVGSWAAEVQHLRKIPGQGDLSVTDWSQCVFDPNRLIIKV